jgi:uncharacterized membrane protein YfcA
MEQRIAPGATLSLVFGILGLIIFAFVFGPLAIWQASKARKAIQEAPELGGGGRATAGLVLGILSIVFWVIGIFVML